MKLSEDQFWAFQDEENEDAKWSVPEYLRLSGQK